MLKFKVGAKNTDPGTPLDGNQAKKAKLDDGALGDMPPMPGLTPPSNPTLASALSMPKSFTPLPPNLMAMGARAPPLPSRPPTAPGATSTPPARRSSPDVLVVDDDKPSVPQLAKITTGRVIQIIDWFQKKDTLNTFRDRVTDDIAPGYSSKIKKGMWLLQIRTNAIKELYTEWEELQADFDLMFDNCILFNGPQSQYGQFALKMKAETRSMIETVRNGGKLPGAGAAGGGRGRGRGRGRPPGSSLKPKETDDLPERSKGDAGTATPSQLGPRTTRTGVVLEAPTPAEKAAAKAGRGRGRGRAAQPLYGPGAAPHVVGNDFAPEHVRRAFPPLSLGEASRGGNDVGAGALAGGRTGAGTQFGRYMVFVPSRGRHDAQCYERSLQRFLRGVHPALAQQLLQRKREAMERASAVIEGQIRAENAKLAEGAAQLAARGEPVWVGGQIMTPVTAPTPAQGGDAKPVPLPPVGPAGGGLTLPPLG